MVKEDDDFSKKALWALFGRNSKIGDYDIHRQLLEEFYRLPEHKELARGDLDKIQHQRLDDVIFGNEEIIEKIRTNYRIAEKSYQEFERRLRDYKNK